MTRTAVLENIFYAAIVALILAFSPQNTPDHYGLITPSNMPMATKNTFKMTFSVDWKPHRSNLKALTETQKQVIQAIVSNERFWNAESNLLEVFGLPIHREELRKLI
jgi:hypothetical protein